MTSRRHLLAGSAAGLFCASFGATRQALAQVVGKVSRVVVGFSPGGAPDVVARLLAEQLKANYAPTLFVDNKPGAGGRIAVEAVKKSEGDGATMLVTPNPMLTIYPHVYKHLAYDPLRDLAPVTSLCSYPLVLTVGPGVPAQVNTLHDLVQWAKATPGGISFGTPAAGSTLHFIGLMLSRAAGIELTHVPYRGGAEIMQDLLGGRIPLAITPPAPVVPHIRAGKWGGLAPTSHER
jgi:tripartite-type tricarboxylate transporter receptor subunit TctC